MLDTGHLETRQTDTLADFLHNTQAHLDRLGRTRTPEILTVDGQAAVVLLDPHTYEALLERLHSAEEVAHARAALRDAGAPEDISDAERARREAVMQELTAETERLGLYQTETERLGLAS